MNKISVIGIDLGKHAFHVHGVDEQGNRQVQRQVSRTALRRWLVKLKLRQELVALDERVAVLDGRFLVEAAVDERCRRLQTIPGWMAYPRDGNLGRFLTHCEVDPLSRAVTRAFPSGPEASKPHPKAEYINAADSLMSHRLILAKMGRTIQETSASFSSFRRPHMR